MSLLGRFLDFNRRLSRAVEDRLPAGFTRHLHTLYKYEVAALVNRAPGQVVLDIGGGKDCPFLPFVAEPHRQAIVAVDYSEEELRRNPALRRRVVADAAAPAFPFGDGSADLIVSRSVVEHLHDNHAFLQNCARALRPGGVMVHTFPCRFAPFSLLNQLIPNRLARSLIAAFHPQWEQECGFVAFYDRCYDSAIRSLLDRTGFKRQKFYYRYYQSIYFDFLFPIYLLMLSYDLLVWLLGIRNLACGILVVAQLPPAEPDRSAHEAPEPSATTAAMTAADCL